MVNTLYIAENCHDCNAVLKGLKEKQLDIPFVNFDLLKPNLSVELFIFAVLLNDRD
jgi:arsenate reductase-like glutaredoxin family protein